MKSITETLLHSPQELASAYDILQRELLVKQGADAPVQKALRVIWMALVA